MPQARRRNAFARLTETFRTNNDAYIDLIDADYELGDSTGTYLWRIDVPDVQWIAVRLNYRIN